MGGVKHYKRTDCKQAMKQHEGTCPFTSIIKDQTAKARLLRIKCVSLLDINIEGFSLAKLYQQRILHLHVVMNKIYNCPEKSELPKFILQVKISWLIISAVSGMEMKNLQRSEQAHFLVLWLRRSISPLQLHHAHLCFDMSLLAG